MISFMDPPVRKLPRRVYRKGLVNRKYPKAHQGAKEKARRAKRLRPELKEAA